MSELRGDASAKSAKAGRVCSPEFVTNALPDAPLRISSASQVQERMVDVQATTSSCYRLVFQEQQLIPLQLSEGESAPFRVEEFHFKNLR